jgi:SAM-dependent methyltransferase
LSTLTHAQARRAYDRIGSLQDTQAFYEDAATGRLLREGSFSSADSVFEFGCGTGRFARRLFDEQLSPTARYRGVDLSPEMVRLATRRLEPYAPRAEVALSEGGPPVDEPSDHYDRFVSNYVFDLLSDEDMRSVVREAHRMLRPVSDPRPARLPGSSAGSRHTAPRSSAAAGPSSCCRCSSIRSGRWSTTRRSYPSPSPPKSSSRGAARSGKCGAERKLKRGFQVPSTDVPLN